MSRATPPRSADASAGFTIIEVLIALVVIAVLLTAVGSVVAATSRGTRALEQRVALLETVRSLAANLQLHNERGIVASAGETAGHRWRIDLSPWSGGVSQSSKSPWLPQIVTLQVRSPSGALVALQTVRLQRRPGG